MINLVKILLISLAIITFYGCTVQTVSPQQPEVRIVRDNYGVPHVYADDIYGLYYGFGYSIAQDRLFQMEMARRSTQGTVAEVLGVEYLEYDTNTRKLFKPQSIIDQLNNLDDDDMQIFAGYAAGINRWLSEIRQQPGTLTPKQFIDLNFSPSDWSAYDVAMIFIGTMNNRFGDFNSELENASIYQSLVQERGEPEAQALFELLNPRFTTGSPTTIPEGGWTGDSHDALGMSNYPGTPINNLALNYTTFSGFSNCFVLGKEKVVGANSILINGPQFGWFNPSYVYSIGLHGAGINVTGNTPFGYPIILFGHNRRISWGSTWGGSDIVDVYSEQVNPDNKNEYFYKGRYEKFEHRVETIKVKDQADMHVDVYRSVHGPVVIRDEKAGVAYAKQRSWEGRELENLLAWLRSTWADDYEGWKDEIAKMSINVNGYFADVDGNIGYFHGGRFPVRATGHDNRFPVSGDGSMDWGDRQNINTGNPHVQNPSSHYLANWNNKPADGAMNPDFFFFNWANAHRVDVLHDLITAKPRFTAEEAWSILEPSSYTDVNAAYLLPIIDRATQGSQNTLVRQANEILQSWDRISRDSDGDGNYDEVATVIFRSFLNTLNEMVLADDLGEAYKYFAYVGYPTAEKPTPSGSNTQSGIEAIIDVINGNDRYDIFNGEDVNAVIVSALEQSLEGLTDSGKVELASLQLNVAPRPYSYRNFLGIPQANESEALLTSIEQNRGTENNMIVMKPGAIVAWEVTPPGQNAFISPDGEKSDHYDDQLDMYSSFNKKRVWFYEQDVEDNKQSEITLILSP